MATLLIAYDLAGGAASAAEITQAIRHLSIRWARPMATVWYLETNASIEKVETFLAPLLAEEDALMVQEVTGQPALINTMARWTAGEQANPAQRAHRLRLAVAGNLPRLDQDVAEAA